MAQAKLSTVLENKKSVLILLSQNPFFDQVAAALSLFLSLSEIDNGRIKTQISCPTQMLVEFNRLVGIDKIKTEIGNKNLVIRFAEQYQPEENIEKVSYDVDQSGVRLTIVPKEGSEAPKEEDLSFSYEGLDADVVFLIGGINVNHFPGLFANDFKNKELIHINTLDGNFGLEQKIISFSYPASSVSEIIASLLFAENFSINEDIATNLIMGIYHGSKNFNSNNVTSGTFEMASKLMEHGAKILKPEPITKRNFPPGAIPGHFPPQMMMPQMQNFPRPNMTMPQMPFLESPQVESVNPNPQNQVNVPQSWMEPKIFKGTTQT